MGVARQVRCRGHRSSAAWAPGRRAHSVPGLVRRRWPLAGFFFPHPRLGEEPSHASPPLPAQPASLAYSFRHPTSPSHPPNGTASAAAQSRSV